MNTAARTKKMVLTYAAAFLLLFIMHSVHSVETYPFDSGTYWTKGYAFGMEQFRFTNFQDDVRGYLYPFLHYILIKLASLGIGTEQINLWLFHSLLYAFLFVKLLPDFLEEVFQIEISYFPRMAFTMVCAYFLKGLILYPLSDLPALCFATLALHNYWHLTQNAKPLPTWSRCLKGFKIGVYAAAAYYIRPVYLILLAVLCGSILYSIVRRRNYALAFAALGLLLVAAPQSAINHANAGTYHPAILTYDSGDSLFLKQLGWGISYQKYETTLDVEQWGSPSVYFEDQIGKRLVEKDGGFGSYWEYIQFVCRHFADVACIYMKHIFNGMDLVFRDVYIKNIYAPRFFTQFFHYTMLFAGLHGLSVFFFCKKWNFAQIGFCTLYLLPVLLSAPTAVETRFFTALHLLFYLSGCMALFKKRGGVLEKKTLLRNIAPYIGFISLCFLFNSQTFNATGIPLW